MKPKNFKYFLNEENSFVQDMMENNRYLSIVADLFCYTLEHLPLKEDSDNFYEFISEKVRVDATHLIDLDLTQKIELCNFAESIDFPKCPETKWDDLEGVIENMAISAFEIYFNETTTEIITKVDEFIKENHLNLKYAYWDDPFSFTSSSKIEEIKDGEIYYYEKSKLFVFNAKFSGRNVEIYFRDALKMDAKKFGL